MKLVSTLVFLVSCLVSQNILLADSLVLQNGLNGYAGCVDTYIGDKDITPFGAAKILRTEVGP